jgi:hypothetical protein
MPATDLSHALIEGVGQFAGTFTSPLAIGIVLALAWVVRRRTAFRLAGLATGALLALPKAWASGEALTGGCLAVGGMLGALLQVEFILGVLLPVLALLRRLRDAVMGLFRTPTLPPGP